MSSRHPPSTNVEQGHRIYPTSGASEHARAAAQLPAIGPNILPPPSMLARPAPWYPAQQPQPLFTPDPALTRPHFYGSPAHDYLTSPQPQSYYLRSPTQLSRPTQQAAAPLENLLHPAPHNPTSSESPYVSTYREQGSRQYQQQPISAQNAHPDRSAFQPSSAHGTFEASRQYPLTDEASFNTRALPSPNEQLHQNSVSSQQSSTNSSSGYGAAPALSIQASLATQTPRNPRDM